MKKKYTVALFLNIFIVFSIFSATNGVETSDFIFNQLKKKHFSPKSQNLISQGSNNFPYNIYLYFPATIESENFEENENCGIYIFYQNQFENNETLLLNYLNALKNQESSFDTYVLFSFGDNPKIEETTNIYGSKVFLDSINAGQEIFAVFFDLDAQINTIQSFTNGYTTPSSLLHNIYNCAAKSKIEFIIPKFYITQIASLNFSNNYLMNLFFKENVPNILIKLNGFSENKEELEDFIFSCTTSFSNNFPHILDKHFLLFKISRKHYAKLSEKAIVIFIVLIIFSFLSFIFIYFFIMHRRQSDNWKKIRQIWYSLPLTFFAIFVSLFLGKLVASIFVNNKSEIFKLVITFNFQMFISLFLIFSFSCITLILNKNVKPEAIDFLVILSSFINQFIFLLVDISLFPLFMIICIIAIFSQFITNRYIKILFFSLMTIPFFVYLNNFIFSLTNLIDFYNYILNPLSFIFISLAIYPFYILLIRIISSFCTNEMNLKKLILKNVIGFIILTGVSVIFSVTAISKLNKIKNPYNISVIFKESDEIKISHYDKSVFDNKIRTLNIQIPENSEICKIKITGKNGNPVQYSDNSYFIENANTAYFLVPQNPPKQLTFSYGIPDGKSEIQVTNYIKNQEYEFYRLEKSYIIE